MSHLPGNTIKAVPIRRRDGSSGPWIMTAEHKAQAWCVAIFRRGEKVALLSMVRKPTKHKAELLVPGIERASQPPVSHGYKLGQRMGVRKA